MYRLHAFVVQCVRVYLSLAPMPELPNGQLKSCLEFVCGWGASGVGRYESASGKERRKKERACEGLRQRSAHHSRHDLRQQCGQLSYVLLDTRDRQTVQQSKAGKGRTGRSNWCLPGACKPLQGQRRGTAV